MENVRETLKQAFKEGFFDDFEEGIRQGIQGLLNDKDGVGKQTWREYLSELYAFQPDSLKDSGINWGYPAWSVQEADPFGGAYPDLFPFTYKGKDYVYCNGIGITQITDGIGTAYTIHGDRGKPLDAGYYATLDEASDALDNIMKKRKINGPEP